jgi:hypothetical protein
VEKYVTARQATDDNIIRRMRFACCITKATDTLRTCNTYSFSTAKMVTRTHLNITLIRTLPVLLRHVMSEINNEPKCPKQVCIDNSQMKRAENNGT